MAVTAVTSVVFDVGGVLLDHDPRRLYRSLIPDRDELEWFLSTVCTSEWNATLDAGRPFDEACRELADRYPAQAEWIHAWKRQDEMVAGEIDGTAALVRDLRTAGVPLYLLTNMPADVFESRHRRYDVLRLFDGAIVSGREGLLKPDAAIFELLSSRFALDLSRTLFIDDKQENVDGARQVGLVAERFTRAEALEEVLRRYGLPLRTGLTSASHIDAVLTKAENASVPEPELAALRRRLRQLDEPDAGMLPGDLLQPLPDLPRLEDLPEPTPEQARAVLEQLVILKLNGGLGTTMGLSGPKSLLEVKPGASFLDVAATQVLGLRERYGARVPLLLMDTTASRDASLDALQRYADLVIPGLPLDFLQGRQPKLRADNLLPVEWPADPELEWCPPGHGDIYPALAASGTLDALLAAGLRYAFVSNADNLGALADVRIAAWFADEQLPFALETVRGTPADRKGGHLALYEGRVVLRETAQVPAGDSSFSDVERWRWYNTNNIWIDLVALKRLQQTDPAAPDLPLIANRKVVDPLDPDSTPVIQLEAAMGAAIGSIPGARALHIPRDRFAPVKTTDDLLVVRSDAYELTGEGEMKPTFEGSGPVVTLDKELFGLLPDFDQRFASGAPSLRRCRRFEVEGDVTFGAGVVAVGDVRVSGPAHIPDGTVLG